MDKINVLIIEDTKEESDRLLSTLENTGFNVVGVANSLKEALQLFYANNVDVCIIDIFLNGIPEGISFAETLNNTPNSARPFVFLTSSTDRAVFERAKLTKPFSFLMKPFNPLEVTYALEMAIEKFYDQPEVFQNDDENTIVSSEYLFVKKRDTLKKVSLSDIIHIEVEERYCTIYTKTDKFVIQISMTKMLELLDLKTFYRVHRNHIVSISEVVEIQTSDSQILMSNNQYIPYSDKYKDILASITIVK